MTASASRWHATLIVVSAVLAWSVAPAVAQPGEGCDGGEIHDDGEVDTGLMSSTPRELVDRFTPATYPHVYQRICICLSDQVGVQDDSLELRIYDDDGLVGGLDLQGGKIPSVSPSPACVVLSSA